MMNSGHLFAFLLSCLALAGAQNVDSDDVKCEVCKITVLEMLDAVAAIDPKKMVNVGNFRMDASGNTISKKVPYSKSETYLTDLMDDNICDKMDDYAKVIHKKTKRLMVIKLMVNDGMNPIVSEVDFVHDGDLNKSLKHYCLQVLEEYEDIFMKAFMAEKLEEDLDIKICSERAKCCMEGPAQEAYNLEDESEYKEEL